MRSLKIAAAAMALAMPGMAMAATDGTLGETSTGNFGVDLEITAANAGQVQVFGLDDLHMGSYSQSNPTQNSNASDYFCLSRSTPGRVLVSIQQLDGSGSDFFVKSAGANPQTYTIYLNYIEPISGLGTDGRFAPNVAKSIKTSEAGCSASSGNGIAHYLYVQDNGVGGNAGPTGTFSGQFSMLVAPE
jgi:hypothetical protein